MTAAGTPGETLPEMEEEEEEEEVGRDPILPAVVIACDTAGSKPYSQSFGL